jgi:uncharacterized protein DUF1302
MKIPTPLKWPLAVLCLAITFYTGSVKGDENSLAVATPAPHGDSSDQASSKTGSFWKDKFQYEGTLRQETAFRLGEPKNFSKIKEYADFNLKFLFNDHVHLKLGGRAWFDAVYVLTDQFPPDVNSNMEKEVILRDAYLDFFLPKVNIRLGHQQIVWGEALGQFFADVVNPLDIREFFLPSFDYIRSQIWAMDLRYFFLPNATLELVATPDQNMDKLALPGSDFAFFIPPATPGFQQILLPDDPPASNFKNWNGGGRISYLTHGWDFSWLFYTSPRHFPVFFKSLVVSNTTTPEIQLQPRHPRTNDYGFTVTKGVKSSVLRGEFVYSTGGFFNASDITVNQGVVQRNLLRYMLGFDTTLGGKVDMNAEFQQQLIFGNTADLADPNLQTWLLLRFEYGFLNEKLIPELLFIVELNSGVNSYIGPRLSYHPKPSITLTWGADVFLGPPDTFYGEFQQKSRAIMYTQWKF